MKLKDQKPSEVFKKVLKNLKEGVDTDIEIDPEIKEQYIRKVEKRAKMDAAATNFSNIVGMIIILVAPIVSIITNAVLLSVDFYTYGYSFDSVIKAIYSGSLVIFISTIFMLSWFIMTAIIAFVIGLFRKLKEIKDMKKVLHDAIKENEDLT